MEPYLSPLLPPKPPTATSKKALLGIFITAFVILLAILNGPALVKAIAYPFTHSTGSNNEQLTQQYRDIYGYEHHPELITAAEITATPTPRSVPTIQPVSRTEIYIPKINVSAPVLQVTSSGDTEILNALKDGVVLYPGSTNPGQPGMAVIIGHSSSNPPWTKYSAVFSLLGKLQPNDLIYITVDDTQYVYRIRAVQKGSAQQLIDSGLAGDLIVSTCWPIGTDTNRIAVSATLIQ